MSRIVLLLGSDEAKAEARRLASNRRHRLRYAKHKEEERARSKRYREANKEKERERQRRYRAANREKFNGASRVYYWTSEKRREFFSAYHKARNSQERIAA